MGEYDVAGLFFETLRLPLWRPERFRVTGLFVSRLVAHESRLVALSVAVSRVPALRSWAPRVARFTQSRTEAEPQTFSPCFRTSALRPGTRTAGHLSFRFTTDTTDQTSTKRRSSPHPNPLFKQKKIRNREASETRRSAPRLCTSAALREKERPVTPSARDERPVTPSAHMSDP